MSDFAPAFSHLTLERVTREQFTLVDLPGQNHRFQYHAMQIQSFIHYDAKLRAGNVSADAPGGYSQFVANFNHDDASCAIKFATLDPILLQVSVSGAAPTLTDFKVRTPDIYEPVVTVVESNSVDSILAAGGMVLDSHRAGLTSDLLWRSAGVLSRRERLINERKAARKATTTTNQREKQQEKRKQRPRKRRADPPTLSQTPIPAFATHSNDTDMYSFGDLDAFTSDNASTSSSLPVVDAAAAI